MKKKAVLEGQCAETRAILKWGSRVSTVVRRDGLVGLGSDENSCACACAAMRVVVKARGGGGARTVREVNTVLR